MSRMTHRPRRQKLPGPEPWRALGHFNRGILWAELRARQQEEQRLTSQKRLDGRDPIECESGR